MAKSFQGIPWYAEDFPNISRDLFRRMPTSGCRYNQRRFEPIEVEGNILWAEA